MNHSTTTKTLSEYVGGPSATQALVQHSAWVTGQMRLSIDADGAPLVDIAVFGQDPEWRPVLEFFPEHDTLNALADGMAFDAPEWHAAMEALKGAIVALHDARARSIRRATLAIKGIAEQFPPLDN